MKCKFCGGSGKDYWCLNGVPYPCPVCNGTGECKFNVDDKQQGRKKPQTTDEWFCSLPIEEKAKILNDVFWKYLNYVDEYELIDDDISELYLRWLKEEHYEMPKM